MASKRRRSNTAKSARKRAAERRKQETPEQRALRLEKNRVCAATRRACETEEQRANRLARDRARIQATRANLKKKAAAALQLNKLQSTSQDNLEKADSFNVNKLSKRLQSSYKSYLLLEAQRAAAAKYAAERRSRETLEQRAIRLEKSRIRSAIGRACESEEMRAIRLARQRIRTREARFKQQLNEITLFQNRLCELGLNGRETISQTDNTEGVTNCGIWDQTTRESYLQEMLRRQTYMFLQAALAQQQMALEPTSPSDRSFPWTENDNCATPGVDVECEVTIEVKEEVLHPEPCHTVNVENVDMKTDESQKHRPTLPPPSCELFQMSELPEQLKPKTNQM